MTIDERFDGWWKNHSPGCPKGVDRKKLIKYFGEWGFRLGVEVGVDKGKFSEFMCRFIPDLKLASIDPWVGRTEKNYELAKKRLSKYPGCHIIRKTSMEAMLSFEDNSLDFVYIDGSHDFDFVMTDIILWAYKVKPGGIIAGHDYHAFRPIEVIEAVNAYTRAHGIIKWFVTDERYPSWFWRK